MDEEFAAGDDVGDEYDEWLQDPETIAFEISNKPP
jgi:hypothetical protein